MVARIDNELLWQSLLTPRPELSDSDDVLLALETARALETQGELREAARWLRRAVDEAEQQGDDERVLVLARAAADMANIVGSSPPPGAEAPTMPPPSPAVLDADDEQYPPTTPPLEAFAPTIPPSDEAHATLPPASASATLPPPSPTTISSPPDMPITERSMRIGAIRVAIAEGSVRGVKSFSVERLDKGQSPPAGMTEAMLVFTGEAESAAEQDFDLLASSDSMLP
ncbi:MAG TPA: hypothetical protein VK550_31695 [Polyangiaceae bacterium]|nr:hypothetical protein [Polyangiaceae bacterium]